MITYEVDVRRWEEEVWDDWRQTLQPTLARRQQVWNRAQQASGKDGSSASVDDNDGASWEHSSHAASCTHRSLAGD